MLPGLSFSTSSRTLRASSFLLIFIRTVLFSKRALAFSGTLLIDRSSHARDSGNSPTRDKEAPRRYMTSPLSELMLSDFWKQSAASRCLPRLNRPLPLLSQRLQVSGDKSHAFS